MYVALFVLSLAVILQSSQECPSYDEIEFNDRLDGTLEMKSKEYRDFPYIVSLRGRFEEHTCSGTILNSEWVITAANCTRNLENIKAGSDNYIYSLPHRVIVVRLHEKFVPFVKHDIALLKITPPIKFTYHLKWANLPKQYKETPIGTRATTVGWGSMKVDGSRSPELLKQNVTVVNMRECMRTSIPNNPPHGLLNICAVAADYQKTAFIGDSGGPLIANDEIIGIASFETLGCGDKFCPTVYTKVSKYVPWILSTIGPLETDKKNASL